MGKKRPDLPFLIFILLCGTAILACGGYLLYHYVYLPARVDAQNARYEALYRPQATETPTLSAAKKQMQASTHEPIKEATPIPGDEATAAPTQEADVVADIALGTPDPDTIVYAFPTPPPIQESFTALLTINQETVGYLTIGDMLSLPVVQRQNDNEFYLTHDFEGEKSQEGSLFLDGVNRLALDDKLLIVYGHNMKNGTMFGQLPNFEFTNVLMKNAVVSFDTIYENRNYVPFACFALTAAQSDPAYVELRQFQFTQSQFDDYVAALKERSLLNIPVDVQYGDDVLLLVTCNYSIDDGRFCVALRQLREDENEDDMRSCVDKAVRK